MTNPALRTYWKNEALNTPVDEKVALPSEEVAKGLLHRVYEEREANLISSSITGALGKATGHYPAIDIDVPFEKVDSTNTEKHGGGHLFIDVELTWNEYRLLLHTLATLGIVEPGYVAAAEMRGATFVRKPGEQKPEEVQTGGAVSQWPDQRRY